MENFRTFIGLFAVFSFVVFIMTSCLAILRRQALKKRLKEECFPGFEDYFIPSFRQITLENSMNEVRFFIFGQWERVVSENLKEQLAKHRQLELFYIISYTVSMLYFIIYFL